MKVVYERNKWPWNTLVTSDYDKEYTDSCNTLQLYIPMLNISSIQQNSIELLCVLK